MDELLIILFDIFSSLIVTFGMYSLPIVIYRFLFRRKPVKKKDAKIISLLYGIFAFLAMSVLIFIIHDGGAAGPSIVLWSYINYVLLKSGSNDKTVIEIVQENISAESKEPSEPVNYDRIKAITDCYSTISAIDDRISYLSALSPSDKGDFKDELQSLKKKRAIMKFSSEELYESTLKLRRYIAVLACFSILLCIAGVAAYVYTTQKTETELSDMKSKTETELSDTKDKYEKSLKKSANIIEQSLETLRATDKQLVKLKYKNEIAKEILAQYGISLDYYELDLSNPLAIYAFGSGYENYSSIRSMPDLKALTEDYPELYKNIK